MLCTEIAVQEDFVPKYDFSGDLRGGRAKKFFYAHYRSPYFATPHKLLLYNSTTAPDPSPLGVISPSFLIPLDAFGISILDALGASSLVPHFSEQSYAPGWPQASHQLNSALHGHPVEA